MAVTVNDVAKACGLPVSLVDRVLKEGISEADRKKVWEAAESLGYTAGSAPVLNHNLGLMLIDESGKGIQHPFFANIVNAFKKQAEAKGYDITFISLHTPDYVEHCLRRQVDGAALVCVPFESPKIQALLNSGFPCVTIDYQAPGHPCVSSDNTSGIKMLVDYAVSMGHRRIAYIHGQRNSDVTEARIAQFVSSMQAHQLPIPSGYLAEGRYDDPAVVQELMEKLLSLPTRPTCVLLPDDATYFAARQTVRENELRIPSDISLAGYDGSRLMEFLRPRLTTIQQNGEEMGRVAADRLIWQLEHPGQPIVDPVVVPVTLVKGDTIGWCNEW